MDDRQQEIDNIGVLSGLDIKLRRYTLESKLELCRKIAHMVDKRLGEKKFIYTTFNNAVNESYYKSLRSTVHLFELEYLSCRATVIQEWEGTMKSTFSSREFSTIVNSYKNYYPPFIHIKDDIHDEFMLDLFIIRTAHQQFHFQWHPLIDLYRYDYLFNYKSSEFEVKNKFKELFGSSFNEYVGFVTGLFLLSKNTVDHAMTVEQIVRELGTGNRLTPEKVFEMLNLLSMDREMATAKYHELKTTDDRMIIYSYNPFTMKPLLIEENKVYLPIPQLLFQAITLGFYHMLCFTYKQKFRSDFGKYAYEDYIHHVFSWESNKYEIIREFEYNIGNEKYASPDFILVKGNEVVLVEIKATAPKIQLREADIQTYLDELKKAYCVAVVQCHKKENHIRKGYLKHEKLPVEISRFFYLVITLEEFYFMNSERLRKQVKEYSEEEGHPLSDNQKYHTLGTVTLEQVIETDERDIFEFLRDRENEEKSYNDASWTTINPTNYDIKLRAVEYWGKEINNLSQDLFGENTNVITP
jgi:Holliday junction resolvase